jgi:glutathione S-transferase
VITICGMHTSGNAFYACTHCAGEGGFDLSAFSNIRKWLARVQAQSGHTPMQY